MQDTHKHVWNDTFTQYAAGDDASAHWAHDSLGWSVSEGQYLADGRSSGRTWPRALPPGRRVVVSATVTPLEAGPGDWKTIGVSIRIDDANFWHLALAESPEGLQRRHFVELTEMLSGQWLAQNSEGTRLEQTVSVGNDLNWSYGHPYRLRLTCDEAGIEGTVTDASGVQVTHIGYRFTARAARGGRPTLTFGSMKGAFTQFEAAVEDPMPEPAGDPVKPYTLAPQSAQRCRSTGFFRVEKQGDRWWYIDPNGYRFYAVGTDHVNCQVHWCEQLGYAPYSRNVFALYGTEERWAKQTAERLKQWGFNTLGANNSPSVRYRGLPHTLFLSMGADFTSISDIAPRTTWTGFPDVFHPQWERWCALQAERQCVRHRDDPWLLGYFLDNELEWFGKSGAPEGLVDETFRKPADHPAKQALLQLLRKRYPGIEGFNRAWGVRFGSWDDLVRVTEPVRPMTEAGREDQVAFVKQIADRYFAVTCAAIRRVDPHHLILGCRFAGTAPDVWDVAGKHLDVVSVNYYGKVDLERRVVTDLPKAMDTYHRLSGRPLMITEWSFPALDAGLPSRHGAGQRVSTQADKALAYSIYQRRLFGMPYMVGSMYFMWVDEPELGISASFPEDSNYGLVDVNDRPWPELTQMASRVNRMAVTLHAGEGVESEVRLKERGAGVDVQILAKVNKPTSCPVRVDTQGRSQRRLVSLRPGRGAQFRLPVTGTALITVTANDDDSLPEVDLGNNRADVLAGLSRTPSGSVVVTNPGALPLSDLVIEIPAPSTRGWAVIGPNGRAVRSQTEARSDGHRIAFVVERAAPHSVLIYRLRPAGSGSVLQPKPLSDSWSLPGKLSLYRMSGPGPMITSLRLDGAELGNYGVVLHQENGQPLWTPALRWKHARIWQGPVRTVLLITADGGDDAAITAVSPDGVYAPKQAASMPFTVTARLIHMPQTACLDVQLVSIMNRSDRPNRIKSYYHYPASRLGGSDAGDEPIASADLPMWYDAQAALGYGAIVDRGAFQATFWRDKPPATGQHPDIWRVIDLTIPPGQTVHLPAGEPKIRLTGLRGDPHSVSGRRTLDTLRACRKVTVAVRRP